MSYLRGVYTPNGASGAAPASSIAGPSSIGLATSVQGSASNIAGPVALIVLLGGLVGLYLVTRRIQGSIGR